MQKMELNVRVFNILSIDCHREMPAQGLGNRPWASGKGSA
jgi:hypothetical protein